MDDGSTDNTPVVSSPGEGDGGLGFTSSPPEGSLFPPLPPPSVIPPGRCLQQNRCLMDHHVQPYCYEALQADHNP